MLEAYWESIPIGRENAISYPALCAKWGMNERKVRQVLHDLSRWDNEDNYILIRSSSCKGFYRTDNMQEIARYRKECTSRAKRTFAPLGKIRRVMKESEEA